MSPDFKRVELAVLTVVDKARLTCPAEATVWHAWSRRWPSKRWSDSPARGTAIVAALEAARAARDDAERLERGGFDAVASAEAAIALLRAAQFLTDAIGTAAQVRL